MKSTVSESEFPKLMIATTTPHFVVLFSKKFCGMVVNVADTDDYSAIGHYSTHWNMAHFSEFVGEVVLSSSVE
jgi:hypothetical protein